MGTRKPQSTEEDAKGHKGVKGQSQVANREGSAKQAEDPDDPREKSLPRGRGAETLRRQDSR